MRMEFQWEDIGKGCFQCGRKYDSYSSGGVVVRALASHQCGPGSIPILGVICGLTLLVLFIALKGFAPGAPVFPSPQKLVFD